MATWLEWCFGALGGDGSNYYVNGQPRVGNYGKYIPSDTCEMFSGTKKILIQKEFFSVGWGEECHSPKISCGAVWESLGFGVFCPCFEHLAERILR